MTDEKPEGEVVPYFEFTTVSVHGVVHNMNDDKLEHRAIVEYTDGDVGVFCSCHASWQVHGINPSSFAIQQSFERHLKGD